MLLKVADLAAIKAGDVGLVFRRWRRPTVKTGGALHTSIGVIAIDRVTKIDRSNVSQADARRAGYDSQASLLGALDTRDSSIYRIELHYAGADPRIGLREKDDFTDVDFEALRARLRRLDSASRVGAWTLRVLQSIQRHPRRRAAELAGRLEVDKDWLKSNVRKLKTLGLTVSHHPGYELSPRGRAVLERLEEW